MTTNEQHRDASSTSQVTSTSSHHAVIRTDGGSLDVSGDGQALAVNDVTTAAGWELTIDHPDARRVDATFTKVGSRIEVSITATAGGISSSTRSSSTSSSS
ncbi:MAG: hypothetical protein JWM12_1769 [Ilumatobacteraceae bacterium]|nr:hypothetical protein [Ilumatobacteraceae bacterium]